MAEEDPALRAVTRGHAMRTRMYAVALLRSADFWLEPLEPLYHPTFSGLGLALRQVHLAAVIRGHSPPVTIAEFERAAWVAQPAFHAEVGEFWSRVKGKQSEEDLRIEAALLAEEAYDHEIEAERSITPPGALARRHDDWERVRRMLAAADGASTLTETSD